MTFGKKIMQSCPLTTRNQNRLLFAAKRGSIRFPAPSEHSAVHLALLTGKPRSQSLSVHHDQLLTLPIPPAICSTILTFGPKTYSSDAVLIDHDRVDGYGGRKNSFCKICGYVALGPHLEERVVLESPVLEISYALLT
jgi:hypothetical protein